MAKGAAFERKIAKQLSLWWTKGKNDNVFWRTANSGGRATVRRKKGKQTKYDEADLKAIDPIGQPLMDLFSMELKCGYKDSHLQDLLQHAVIAPREKSSCWWNWIKQSKKARKASGSIYWCLIVQKRRAKALIAMPLEIFQDLTVLRDFPTIEINLYPGNKVKKKIGVCILDDFLKFVRPEKIKRYAELFSEEGRHVS